jgi:hypothetical protein
MHKVFEVCLPIMLVTVLLNVAPTHHQPTLGALALGVGVCILVPTLK